jgi:hypothetical protein
VIPAEAVEAITVDGNTVYLNGHPMAIINGEPITADQVTLLRNVAATPREELMRNLNVRLKAAK